MLSNRNELILCSLDKLRFATRQQLQKLHALGSDRNALKVLRQLTDYTHVRTHHGRNVYYLNQKGREMIGSQQEAIWSLQVDHHLMRNDIYIFLGCPPDWVNEKPIRFKVLEGLVQKNVELVPDAMFKREGIYHFVEVDRTQSMAANQKKVTLYKELEGLMLKQFKHTPRVVFYTVSAFRAKRLKDIYPAAFIYTEEDIR